MADLLRGYLRARGKHRPMLPVRLPEEVARKERRLESGNLGTCQVQPPLSFI